MGLFFHGRERLKDIPARDRCTTKAVSINCLAFFKHSNVQINSRNELQLTRLKQQ